MKKCEVKEYFTLKKFDELENLVRADENNNAKDGELFVGDTFDCTEEMADYLTGNNDSKLVVVRIIGEIEDNENNEDEENDDKPLEENGDENIEQETNEEPKEEEIIEEKTEEVEEPKEEKKENKKTSKK